jgi:glucose/arabinose dehydrogenase
MRLRITFVLAALAALALVILPTRAQNAPRSPTPASTALQGRVTEVVRGLDHPWGLEFLPDGRMIVTERPGRVRIVDRSGRLSAPLRGVPKVLAEGQGGMLDVALDPAFAKNAIVWLSFSEPGPGGTASTAVAKGKLTDGAIEGLQLVYRQEPKVVSRGHYGARIVFRRDGTLFVTQGDRMRFSEKAQDLSSGIGKIVRVNPDGTIPKDNPFVGRSGARPEVWSYGHRNAQSAALDPDTGELWTVEHGARGGDELNNPRAGRNYGWPVISYGVDYSGKPIGQGLRAKAGMEQPVYYWDPVIAPSGMLFYKGNRYPGWKDSIFIGSLSPGALVRLEMKNGRVAKEERYMQERGERIRDIAVSPDGLIHVITDEDDGKILRVEPPK